ncbi:unnamed protein product, partial [Mycena citricolor]
TFPFGPPAIRDLKTQSQPTKRVFSPASILCWPSMSFPVASTYISHLQAISPSLFFAVPLAAVVLFFFAISRSLAHNRRRASSSIHVYTSRQKRRVALAFLVVFSLALLAILAGSISFFRDRTPSLPVSVLYAFVSATLYLELMGAILYLFSVVTNLRSAHPVFLSLLYYFCHTFNVWWVVPVQSTAGADDHVEATLTSIVGSFKPVPLLIAPVLYLVAIILAVPILVLGHLSGLNISGACLAPQIVLSSPSSYPRSSSEKPRIFADIPLEVETLALSSPAPRSISVCVAFGHVSAVLHLCLEIAAAVHSMPESLIFRIVGNAFLVLWTICTIAAFFQFFLLVHHSSRSTESSIHTSTMLTTASEATAFIPTPPRGHQAKSGSRSSSFSSPRPQRKPIPSAQLFRSISPGTEDCQNLKDPFATPPSSIRISHVPSSEEGHRPTRLSAWGSLPLTPPIALPRTRTRVRVPPKFSGRRPLQPSKSDRALFSSSPPADGYDRRLTSRKLYSPNNC